MGLRNIAVIPARYASQRFPGKLMELLQDQTVIKTTYDAVLATQLFDEVLVATDHDLIFTHLKDLGCAVVKSTQPYECGSDRIAAAVAEREVDIVVNVQGDEPFIDRESLAALLAVFEQDPAGEIDLASLKTPLANEDELQNPNVVKVITDQRDCALYFSRSPIPYNRAQDPSVKAFRHIGVYAFRKQALLDFSTQAQTPLEKAEQIECIRHLEYGKKIKIVTTLHRGIGIDTPEDLLQARAYLSSQKKDA